MRYCFHGPGSSVRAGPGKSGPGPSPRSSSFTTFAASGVSFGHREKWMTTFVSSVVAAGTGSPGRPRRGPAPRTKRASVWERVGFMGVVGGWWGGGVVRRTIGESRGTTSPPRHLTTSFTEHELLGVAGPSARRSAATARPPRSSSPVEVLVGDAAGVVRLELHPEFAPGHRQVGVMPGGLAQVADRVHRHERLRPAIGVVLAAEPAVFEIPAGEPEFRDFGFHLVFGVGSSCRP